MANMKYVAEHKSGEDWHTYLNRQTNNIRTCRSTFAEQILRGNLNIL